MRVTHCKKIENILSDTVTQFGWDDFSYSFSQNKDWTDADAIYVQEASRDMRSFLEKYRKLGLQANRYKVGALKSDYFHLYSMEASKRSKSSKERILSDLLDDYGWKFALSCPLYGFGGTLGIVALWTRLDEVPDKMVNDSIQHIWTLIPHFNAWSRELLQDCYATNYSLSPREMDCLQLVAEGRTSKEIGDILSITSRTVDFHVKNATEKLGCASRSQAAWRLSLLPTQSQSK
jgi:DNA-binding CsgD family transcriptional regulator